VVGSTTKDHIATFVELVRANLQDISDWNTVIKKKSMIL